MNSFNFQIVPVANLAAIVTPFPDHICYFTEDTENYYIWENDALKEIFVDASSITWNNVTNKPTTITGFGITDAVKVNNGTLNYLAKFTPDGTTIGNSIIRDNGTNVAIGTTLDPDVKVNILTNESYGIWLENTSQDDCTGIRVSLSTPTLTGSHYGFYTIISSAQNSYGLTAIVTATNEAVGAGGSASDAILNIGLKGSAYDGANTSSTNHGVLGYAAGGVESYGGKFEARNGSIDNVGIWALISPASAFGNKYSVKLQDGTESVVGRYLRNMTTDGKGNWANINITEVTNGLSSTLLGAPNGIATLDNNSKLVMSQMPISVMDYKGTYDIVTNTPNLQDGVGNQGDVYVCTTAGTRTFGVGNTLTVSVGDWLIYNGTKWEKTLGNNVGSGTVSSVGLSLGTTGTDVNVSNSPITSSGNINLNIPTASSTARGLLSTADWTTFNSKVSAFSSPTSFVTRFVGTNQISGGSIQDSGASVSVGNATPSTSIKLLVVNNGVEDAIKGYTNASGKIGVYGVNDGSNVGTNTGVQGDASGSTTLNIGVKGNGSSITGSGYGVYGVCTGTGVSIGIYGEAASGTSKYAIQLKDGTETVAGRFLKNMTTDGKANWANITVSDVSGAVGAVGGTNNYIAKFTPNGTTIGNSKIQDNGTNVYIDDALTIQQAESKFLVSSNNTDKGIQVLMPGSTNNSPVGIVSNVYIATNTKSGTVSGGTFSALGSSTKNIGLQALANQTSTGVHIGIYSDALNGALGNYAIQLRDGSETATGGKFLKDKGDGKANWTYLPDSAQIMCSDMVSAITADTSNPKAIWVAPCDGQLTDAFASLRIPQAGGTAFTVLVKTSLVTIATLTFSNGNLQFMSTNPAVTQAFTKGNIFELYVSQVGDGSARSLLVTLNYLRT